MDKYQISERSACGLVGLSRTTWRHLPIPRDDETPMRAEVIRLASTYGRYGYRTIAGLMRNAGWLSATSQKICYLNLVSVKYLKFITHTNDKGFIIIR